MTKHRISFNGLESVAVPSGTSLTDAAVQAGIAISQPCGGQGRCGRCAVIVAEGSVRRRSTLRLSAEDVAAGYALACQSVALGDASVIVPEQESLERRLTSERVVADIAVPDGYQADRDQTLRRIPLTLTPPSMDDQRDDWSRLTTELRVKTGISRFEVSLSLLRQVGPLLRSAAWQVTAVLYISIQSSDARLVALLPGHVPAADPLWGVSIDIGTTTVTVLLVDVVSGRVVARAAEYNRQIRRGEDVISRVMFATKNDGLDELRSLVLESINTLIQRACAKATKSGIDSERNGSAIAPHPLPEHILKATIAGNSIMMHLFLGVTADNIRLSPFITTFNHLPPLSASASGLRLHPEAMVECLPGVASYVGADITAGVLSSGLDDSELVTLFMDIGTNGETVLGCKDWLVTCACSAGPAFEGAGVGDGMRATRGAIEEIWIDSQTFEPTWRTIGDARPRGLCGSGLIAILGELFLTGLIDKGGHFNTNLSTRRLRPGPHGPEYVVAWAEESWQGEDIVINPVDIDNLLRTKAAIYAGIHVLAESVGVPLESVEQVLIGGSFGQYINVEKAIEIGLLPDLNHKAGWERFHFLGNTAVLGAYYALLSSKHHQRIIDIAGRMTYIELSADNSFYEAFTSALFLPHTDLSLFPSVVSAFSETGMASQPAEAGTRS